ncbi:MAG: response regulator transcription factor [Anaerolineales bacterium]|nr:response regulator transcription factor [Anaerolineales bacterium]
MLRVLIADDHAVVRQGLRQILAEIPELSAVGEAQNGEEALDQVRAEPWDVLVLDMSMPGRGGLDVLKDVRRERPQTRVLVLSMHPEDQFAVRLLKAGAAGYLTKESAPEELVAAVRKVMTGGKYISATLAEKLAFDMDRDNDRPAYETLSDREFQVLRMLATGKTVQQIAGELMLSAKTISTYRARILEKLHLKSNAEMIHYSIQNRLIE